MNSQLFNFSWKLGSSLVLSVFLVSGLFLPVSGLGKLQRAKAKHPVIGLIEQTPLGTSERRLIKRLKKAGFAFERFEWKTKGAMSRGLVGNPHHLKMLNERKVNHPFFDDLPDKGPTFVVASYAGSKAVYGLMDGKVWSLGFGVNLQAQRALDFDDSERVAHIRLLFSELARLCSDLKIEEADAYGNPRVFVCSKGPGGALYARYDATQLDSLSILVYPADAGETSVEESAVRD